MCLRIGSSPISSPTSLFYGFLALQTVGPSQRWDYQYGDQGQCAVIPTHCRTIYTLVNTSPR